MTLSELLNSEMDFASLAATARQGLTWWLDELAAMLPAAWRERLSSRPRLWITPHPDGRLSLWRPGQAALEPLERVPMSGNRLSDQNARKNNGAAGRAKLGLLAPEASVLVRELSLPRMSAGDTRRMVALDIDRLSPLAPDLVHFDVDISDEPDGGRRVLLGIIPRASAAELLALARQAGCAPVALAVRVGGGEGPPRFDFLPKVLEAEGRPARDRVRSYALIAAGVLILANLGLLVGRDMASVTRMRAAVDGQQPGVQSVLRLRRRVDGEDARRSGLVLQGQRDDPLRLLDLLTRVLPPGASVEHLEWNGASLHIVGYEREGEDAGATLKGPFANVRVQSGAAVPGREGARPFEITADARPARAP